MISHMPSGGGEKSGGLSLVCTKSYFTANMSETICYRIETNGKISIYRAEHEERLRKLMSGMVLTPGGSPTGYALLSFID